LKVANQYTKAAELAANKKKKTTGKAKTINARGKKAPVKGKAKAAGAR